MLKNELFHFSCIFMGNLRSMHAPPRSQQHVAQTCTQSKVWLWVMLRNIIVHLVIVLSIYAIKSEILSRVFHRCRGFFTLTLDRNWFLFPGFLLRFLYIVFFCQTRYCSQVFLIQCVRDKQPRTFTYVESREAELQL